MTGFEAEWLDLREPADLRARNTDALGAARAWLSASKRREIVDLGSGTGATFRALQPHLPDDTRWTLVDHDPVLLEAAAVRNGAAVHVRRHDLANLDALDLPARGLVTCSALLDLVSESWLARLVDRLRTRHCAFYAALDVAGPPSLRPPHDADSLVFGAFVAHQYSDKGFGPALGPDAGATAQRLLESAGYRVISGRSDWRLGARDEDLLATLVDGWAGAAAEMNPDHGPAIESWRRERAGQAKTGVLKSVVPHIDLFAEPAR